MKICMKYYELSNCFYFNLSVNEVLRMKQWWTILLCQTKLDLCWYCNTFFLSLGLDVKKMLICRDRQ